MKNNNEQPEPEILLLELFNKLMHNGYKITQFKIKTTLFSLKLIDLAFLNLLDPSRLLTELMLYYNRADLSNITKIDIICSNPQETQFCKIVWDLEKLAKINKNKESLVNFDDETLG